MPLRLAAASKNEPPAIEIIAVPGIGASADETWMFPTQAGNKVEFDLKRAAPLLETPSHSRTSFQLSRRSAESQERQRSETIFDEVPQARVWFFDYNDVAESKEFDDYAEQLLEALVDLVQKQGHQRRPLHLVGHSTGGIVIKHALIQAFADENSWEAEAAEACFSIAFFGVPHYGSTVLYGDAYRATVETATGMKLHNRIRTALNPDHKDRFDEEARSFAPLANSLRKIWTFIEGVESKLQVLSGNTAGEETTIVSLACVDERSATLSTPRVRIGTEKVTTVNTTHAQLARFGSARDSLAFKEYIRDLRALIDELGSSPERSLSWRENTLSDEVMAEVHLFYEVQAEEPDNIIKLFSVDCTLSELISTGPMSQLRRRLTKATQAQRTARLANGIPTGTRNPRSVELERSPREYPSDAASNASVPSVPEADQLPVPSIVVDGKPIEEPQEQHGRRGSITMDRYPHLFSNTGRPMQRAKTVHLTEPQTKGKDEYIEPPKRDDFYELPTLKSYRFRWIRIPCNNMAFVPKILRCIVDEIKQPHLMNNLMHDTVFHSKQAIARHGRPHGRYMQPFFHSIELEKVDIERGIRSPNPERKQFVIYFPYLHWDSFDSLLKRNDIVKRRLERSSAHLDKSIMGGRSKEHRLIWRYLLHSANLPLHLRRSLDQYGYPTLRDVSARDLDQVLYKRTRENPDAEFEKQTAGMRARLREGKRRPRSKIRASARNKSVDGGNTRDSGAKVLMVDTLWMWIMDQETIITCFPSRESDRVSENHADLRDAIYRDVNGDPRLATQCRSCVQFAALTLRHAVTVFLEQKADKDLEVFRIFEEYISLLTEHLTMAFKEFRNKHQKEYPTMDELEDIHDNSKDLLCFLELRDVEDELNTVKKLLEEQKKVIQEFHKVVTSHKLGRNARNWLDDALHKLAEYQNLIDHMLHNCNIAQDNFKTLLDMKQKKANVVEAVLARKAADRAAQQSRAVMTFTVFTVFFLPLSFFTSLFGMNVREWSGTDTNVPMHTALVLMCGISAAVILIALLLAFNKPVRDRFYRMHQRIKDWQNRDKGTIGTSYNDDYIQARGRSFRVFHRKRTDVEEDIERGRLHDRVDTRDFAFKNSRGSSFLSNPFSDNNRMKTE